MAVNCLKDTTPPATDTCICTEEVGKNMLDKALQFCVARCERGQVDEVVQLLKKNDENCHSYLRYSLAKQVADYLGAVDSTLQEVYFYDGAGQETIDMLTPVTLVAVVTRHTPAGDALICSIDHMLTQAYQQVVGEDLVGAMQSLLEIHVVDEAKANSRTGIAAVINGLYTPAIVIWRR